MLEARRDIDCISNYLLDDSQEMLLHTLDQLIWTVMARK